MLDEMVDGSMDEEDMANLQEILSRLRTRRVTASSITATGSQRGPTTSATLQATQSTPPSRRPSRIAERSVTPTPYRNAQPPQAQPTQTIDSMSSSQICGFRYTATVMIP